MTRQPFLEAYNFNWESFDIITGGLSSIDAQRYLTGFRDESRAKEFLKGYGFDIDDPVQAAEVFGNFQEAMQFIKRYFLKEGNPSGLDFNIPNVFYTITDMSELLLIATGRAHRESSLEEMIWAGIILKVMHTILHTDKDLRYRYFSAIQTQIFDRFYKYLIRDEEDKLYLKGRDGNQIPLVTFETKAKKTRESTIIKLLHKKENVAEELFDRVGVRFVTKTKLDVIRVIQFLNYNFIIMANNIKPSRSQNTLIDLQQFRQDYSHAVKDCIRENWSEETFLNNMEKMAENCAFKTPATTDNKHSSMDYRAIHFTCRQLVHHRNPFFKKFMELRRLAAESDENNELAKKVLEMKTESISRDVKFFYPFEVQITDLDSHEKNTEGEASHSEYKKSQLISAMNRLFRPLIELKASQTES